MQIVELRISNVKRVTALEYRPDPGAHVIRVQGPNGAGKSSTIDAIAYALGGARLICAEPLRVGQPTGYVSVDLGEVVVTRTWSRHPHTGTVASVLELRAKDGRKLPRAQQALDTLLGSLSFDPLAFTREPAKRQLELVRELVGLDFAVLDGRRDTIYAERTELGRQLRAADAEVQRRPMHQGLPDEPIALQELVAQIEAAHGLRLRAAQIASEAQRAARSLEATDQTVTRMHREIAALTARIEALTAGRAAELAEAERLATDARLAAEAAQAVDPDVLRSQLAEAESVNQRVRENIDRAQLHARAAELHGRVSALTSEIDGIDLEKERRAAAAELPVPGLGFRHDGLTYQGVPFEQASQAQQIRVSVAMGAALNPALRVLLVRDGSLLGRAQLELLGALAAERGLQVWVERVAEPGEGETSGDVLVIEDGEAVQAAA